MLSGHAPQFSHHTPEGVWYAPAQLVPFDTLADMRGEVLLVVLARTRALRPDQVRQGLLVVVRVVPAGAQDPRYGTTRGRTCGSHPSHRTSRGRVLDSSK